MPGKIFISYRREDSGANAIGIGQYLEHEFGRRNVFIDVDMRAGTRFPTVLEQRLAECKVMLVLIGPGWLDARDEQGNRRLDNPDDWVRLEIAHALKRDITVIPVLVDRAVLPPKKVLPDDIQGLLDRQVVSISLASFRHEMSGLVRDIRAIPSSGKLRRLGVITAGLLCIALMLLIYALLIPNAMNYVRSTLSGSSQSAKGNGFWISKAGEWIVFAVDKQPIAFSFKRGSVEVLEDRVAYTARYPLKPLGNTSESAQDDDSSSRGSYEDDTTVVDCSKSASLLAEKTIYNKAGESISHFKVGDAATLDLTRASQISPGSILSIGEHIFCDEHLRTTLANELATTKLKLLTSIPLAQLFYGPLKKLSDPSYQMELLLVGKFYDDHNGFVDIYPNQTIIGPAPIYRTIAQTMQFDCTNRKMRSPNINYFDADNNLQFIVAPDPIPPIQVVSGSAFDQLLDLVCVSGSYEGKNYATYNSGGEGEQKIIIKVEQSGKNLKVRFEASPNGEGEGTGTLADGHVDGLTLRSTAPDCPGSYDASLNFQGDTVTWLFKGMDCGGSMEGHGTAKRKKV